MAKRFYLFGIGSPSWLKANRLVPGQLGSHKPKKRRRGKRGGRRRR